MFDMPAPNTADPRPFYDIEVVEFGQFIAVPYCAQLLADGGAHVVKIESLEGDPVRMLAPLALGESRHFISRNRGKHSLPLDLKHPRARAVIDALLGRADVVLTNFRPGLAAQLGLDAATLGPRFPRLIVGNVTAFGPRGPDAMLAGMDLVVQARSGLMAANGRFVEGHPAAGDPPVADYMCAMMLAFAVASALLRRERTGRGGEIDLSLLAAALTLQNNAMVRAETADGPAHARLLDELAALRRRGAPYAEQAAVTPQVRLPGMARVYYRTFATKDAALAVACVAPPLQRAFARALGLVDAHHEQPIGDPAAQARHYEELGARAEAVVASRTTAEWKAILDAAGIPAAGVRLPFELLDDEQALANGMLHDLAHPSVGTIRVASTPIRMDGPGFAPSPATPAYGSEARAVLGALGFSEADVDALVRDGVTRTSYPGR